jgi:non-structural maintenance of chromosomes element 1
MVEWEPVLPIGWEHGNRAFLQALMGRGCMTLGEGKSVIAAILSAEQVSGRRITSDSIDDNTFRQYISKAREAVASLDYDIRTTHHQVSREQTWALINVHSDPSTQMATSRTPDEISFIKRVLDAMFETYNTPRQEVMAVTAAQARKVARPAAPAEDVDADGEEPAQRTADRPLKHSEIEKLLPSLVAEGWFEENDEGFYSLSPRSLMELRTWLVAAYNDPDTGPETWQRIKFCEACKEIVTIGQRCPERDCNVRIHDICTEAYWRTRRGSRTCPRCETEWTGQNYVGARAVTETAAAHRQVGRNKKSNGNRSLMDDEADQDVDHEDDGGE